MEIDRRKFIASLGGAAAVAMLTHEERAEALEHYMEDELDAFLLGEEQPQPQTGEYPTVASLAEQAGNLDRPYRRGTGGIFRAGQDGKLRVLSKMPDKPTLLDFFEHRFAPASHVLQSANRALKTGMSEEVILACLLHDVVLGLNRPDHGWWGAQMIEPYVPEKTAFAVRYHQALRFFPDEEFGYEYPESYFRTFGIDYEPEPYLQRTYEKVRAHEWYEYPRLVTVNDLYAFDRSQVITIDPFVDIIGRHFKQPKEGLGNDGSPVAHMWRTIAMPDNPL